jgi:uncharacterized protein YdeI (YjbR/CyaY-like superfamily)
MAARAELPVMAFASRKEWAGWLADNHESSSGLWLKLAKKGSGIESVSQPEAVEVALCYGWIDSQARSFDDEYWLQRMGPRTARSKWSQINRARALELIERGDMQPAGLREVERAKADGRWDAAYAPQSTAKVPDDLQEALDRNPRAREFFSSLDSTNRYAILHRLHGAKKPETRARRIEKFVAMLNERRKIHP